MFHEVRIFNAKGKLKQRFSSKELSSRYWKRISEQELGLNPGPSKTRKISSEMRRKLDAQIPETLSH
jgi:hypothetical protein